MTTDLDLRERNELCDLMLELGPDAPTLCGDWTTFDLAAHLVVRERDPRSAPGILFGGRFEAYTNRLMEREQKRGFEAVVDRVRHVPKGLLSIPPLRAAMNLIEYTVHHEDVRRPAGRSPRTDRQTLQVAIWSKLTQMSGLIVARAKVSPVSLELQPVGVSAKNHRAGKGSHVVTVSGAPVELLLFLYGRQGQADVVVTGDPADVEVATSAAFGI